MTNLPIYLASKSPRRAALLAQMGVAFELLLADDTEDAESLEAVLPNENPSVYVARVTHNKLLAAVARHQRRGLVPAPVLTSDTTVAVGGTILGKPKDKNEAQAMLTLLSGRTHRVITAVGVAKGENLKRIKVLLQTSRVTFARLPKEWVEQYCAGTEPYDKAGGYGIQGSIAPWVKRIDGSYSGIMGLPLYETAKLLGLHHAHRQRNTNSPHNA
jgi:septum formation protein